MDTTVQFIVLKVCQWSWSTQQEEQWAFFYDANS